MAKFQVYTFLSFYFTILWTHWMDQKLQVPFFTFLVRNQYLISWDQCWICQRPY